MEPNKGNSNKDIDLDSILAYYNSPEGQKSVNADLRKDNKTSSADISFNKSHPTNSTVNSAVKPSPDKKKFVIHIDDDELNYSGSQSASKPADSSSIYFSNFKRNNGENSTSDRDNIQRKKQPVSHSSQNKTTKLKKRNKSVGKKFAVILFACILVFTSLFSFLSITTINDILAIKTSDDAIEVTVFDEQNPNAEYLSYDKVIDILADNKMITNKTLCKFFARFRNYDNSELHYLPGYYTLKKSMGLEGMLNKCLRKSKSAETVTISFPEGWTITQMFEKLETNKVCTAKSLYSVLNKYADMHANDYPFVKSVPTSNERYQNFEGYFFPDTYDFYVDSDPNVVIDKLFNSFNTQWSEKYQKRAAELGFSMDEIITIASIIQKEAANKSQMKDISSVIHNRLDNSVNYPTLGCDSTSDYIANHFDTKNFKANQKNHFLNKYDTGMNQGLPPGPICNPGLDSIEAALYPSNTNYTYFQHDINGKIYLASTKSQFDYDYSVCQQLKNEKDD